MTAPACANARPSKFAPLPKVMVTAARMLPAHEVPAPMVADVPTCQKTLHACVPLLVTTVAPTEVVNVLPI